AEVFQAPTRGDESPPVLRRPPDRVLPQFHFQTPLSHSPHLGTLLRDWAVAVDRAQDQRKLRCPPEVATRPLEQRRTRGGNHVNRGNEPDSSKARGSDTFSFHFEERLIGEVDAYSVAQKSIELKQIEQELAVLIPGLIGQHKVHIVVEVP